MATACIFRVCRSSGVGGLSGLTPNPTIQRSGLRGLKKRRGSIYNCLKWQKTHHKSGADPYYSQATCCVGGWWRQRRWPCMNAYGFTLQTKSKKTFQIHCGICNISIGVWFTFFFSHSFLSAFSPLPEVGQSPLAVCCTRVTKNDNTFHTTNTTQQARVWTKRCCATRLAGYARRLLLHYIFHTHAVSIAFAFWLHVL